MRMGLLQHLEVLQQLQQTHRKARRMALETMQE